MTNRERLISIVTLLVATVQLAGVAVVPRSGAGPAAAEYYCCCIGECHCTADCCNHPPENKAEPTGPRIEPGNSLLEAPVRCAVFIGTFTRQPDTPRALPASFGQRSAPPPDRSSRLLPVRVSGPSSKWALSATAPRAPPASVVTV